MRKNLALKRVFLCAALFTVSFYVHGQYPSTCFPLGSDQCQAPSIVSETFNIDLPNIEQSSYSEESAIAAMLRGAAAPPGSPCQYQITFLQDWHVSDQNGRVPLPVKFGVEISSAKSYRRDRFAFENGACRSSATDFFDIYRDRAVNCPNGYSLDAASSTYCRRVDVDPGKALCCADPTQVNAGDQINAALGNKFQSEDDYAGQGPFPLRLTRIFNSGGPNTFLAGFGNSPNLGFRWKYWRHTYDRAIGVVKSTSLTTVRAYRQDGRVLPWNLRNGQYVTERDIYDVLQPQLGSDNTQVGWSYQNTEDELEVYDLSGRLKSITNRIGLMQTLTYSDAATPANVAPWPGLLVSVADPLGRQLLFTYDAQGRTTTVSDPAGGTYRYAYDASGNLTAVTYPDAKVRQYSYEDSDFPKALTGITDENGQRFSTYGYDSQGRAASSVHAGGANQVSLSYSAGQTTVTDALNATRSLTTSVVLGVARVTAISGIACPACGPAAQSFEFSGRLTSRTDWNGNRTTYIFDSSRNLEFLRTEGVTSSGNATPQTRTITTEWHDAFRLPIAVAEPLRVTFFTYGGGAAGNCGVKADGTPLLGVLCFKTWMPTRDTDGSQGLNAAQWGATRSWAYTYNANGSVLSVDGPRLDVSDITTYTYYANDDAELGKRGNVATVTNAAGHVTSITAYNAHGLPTTIIDPNGMTITLGYDARQRLISRNSGGEVTSYDYDGVGQLTKVTLPDGSYLSYAHDAAHRLTGLSDNLGNSIAYTLDAMGNRTREQVFDPANALVQKRSRVYSSANRLALEVSAQNATTQYNYDDQGNVSLVVDPLNRYTYSRYDELNRLKEVTDPSLGVTRYAYNGRDSLIQVTDPRGLVTSYTVDGVDNVNEQISPDTGTSQSFYDEAGNLQSQTDALEQSTYHAYDALNRATLIAFADDSAQTYAYDQGTNGIGRLSSIIETDPTSQITSQIAYAYDLHGRVTTETRTINGIQYVVGYSYDSAGRLTGMTYPSGRTVTYAFDGLGRVSQVNTTKNNQNQVLVQGVVYHPFGGAKGYTLGNGQVYSRGIDLDGRISSYTLGAQSLGIGYDAASRIQFISDFANSSNTSNYDYDNLDRLTQASTPGTPYAYSYDSVGNRISRTAGSSTDSYAYSSTSNRISSITTGSGALRSFVFDANGSTTADGTNTYAYDTRGRMVQAVNGLGTTTYRVNALGQRIRKTSSLGDTVFHYDARGRLIAETDPGGAVKRELFYLGDIPVGVFQ